LHRGAFRKVIEPRIYRAAFLPALLALVLVAFSLESPPRALDQGLAADVLFEGESAMSTVRSIVATAPDRSAGSAGDQATARRVIAAFRTHGFTTTVDRWNDDGKSLVNVVGRRAGNSSRQVVVLAERDSERRPDAAGSAADTAALIEFARVFEGRASQRTLVLASVDGGDLGSAGARRFAEGVTGGQVEAVIVLSDLGARRSRGPLVLGWSNGVTRAGLGLQRTVTGSLREELGSVPGQDGLFSQFARLAFPVSPGAQAVLLDSGLDAVRIAGGGEVGPDDAGRLGDVNVTRYGSLGRSVLRMIATLDASASDPGRDPRSYVTVAGTVLPSWALKLLALALVLPALIASIDALARARRRREPVGRSFRWLGLGALPLLLALVVAWLLSIVGVIDDAPPAAPDPRTVALDGGALAALIVTAVVAAAAWAGLRLWGIRTRASAAAPGAGCAVSLVLAGAVLPIAVLNPFAALVLVPAVHLWMLATLTESRARGAAAMAAIGLLPIVFVIAFILWRLDLSPLAAAYYLLLLVTGNQTGLLTTLAGIVLLAVTISVASILIARARSGETAGGRRSRQPEEPRPSIFGPGGHAGPGAIGSQIGTSRR
jgi:hypothetical protein